MEIHSNSTVGRLATEHPLATRVFHRHGIDFCCGGARTLEQACTELNLDVAAVVEEILREEQGPAGPERRWDQAPLGDLIQHILATYHASLREELPRLESMSRQVLEAHRDKDGDRLSQLLSVLLELKAELESHMAKEEQILFPMIERGQGAMAGGPVSVMEHEHDSAATALRRLREITDDYQIPAEACNTWRALWQGLASLEESLHQHIHLENNILFPRALEISTAKA
jgi:regulator of cell morphogenesis and NO signaling